MASNTDCAWAAGFFDGEGTTTTLKAQRDCYRYLRCSVSQKEPELLMRFADIVGTGKIYRATKRDIHSWDCYRFEDVVNVLNQLWPYLGEIKKQQALAAWATITSEGLPQRNLSGMYGTGGLV